MMMVPAACWLRHGEYRYLMQRPDQTELTA